MINNEPQRFFPCPDKDVPTSMHDYYSNFNQFKLPLKEQLPPKLKMGQACIIGEHTEILGEVIIGNGTVIHPHVKIIAEAGPIIIGENNIIEEKALIWNRLMHDNKSNREMVIGNWNVFEINSTCFSTKIGDNNVLEVRCTIGPDVKINNNCTIGAACVLLDKETLSDNIGVYGDKCLRRNTSGNPNSAPLLETLRRMLHNHNKGFKTQ